MTMRSLGMLSLVVVFGAAGTTRAAAEPAAGCVVLEHIKEFLPSAPSLKAWEDRSDEVPWVARHGHGAAVVNGKLWVYGGYTGGYLNDVWYTENGSTWTRAIASAAWSGRAGFGALAFQNKIWMLGGYDGEAQKNDVYSSAEGVNWTDVAEHAEWDARTYFGHLVFDNRMWVLGGYDSGGFFRNDVWYSLDGTEWIRATENAEWGKRANHAAAVFDDKMWIFGGTNAGSNFRDSWYSEDGIAWIEATDSAPWSGRYNLSVTEYNGQLWLTGGAIGLKDVWYSEEGVNWYEAEVPEWTGRDGHASLTFGNRLYVIGGRNESGSAANEVWTYTPGGGIGCGVSNSRPRAAVPFGDVLALAAIIILLAASPKLMLAVRARDSGIQEL